MFTLFAYCIALGRLFQSFGAKLLADLKNIKNNKASGADGISAP